MADHAREKDQQMIALRDHLQSLRAALPISEIKKVGRKKSSSDYPISFNDEMIRGLLAGRKTETRRLIRTPVARSEIIENRCHLFQADGSELICPFGERGSRLRVRERWAAVDETHFIYAADFDAIESARRKWRPTFHMPRIASRIFLRVTTTFPQPLQQIDAHAAQAEGFDPATHGKSPRIWFKQLWDSIYGEDNFRWADNPWVWVVQFEIEKTSPD